MKNLTLCLCLLLLFLFSQPALAVSAQRPIMLDGINISAPDYPADNQPAILAQEHSGTAYVPLRFIAELFNAEVSWQEQKIIISNGSNTIKIQLGSQQAVCNNESITLSGAPYEYQNTTYVPLRFIAETFACTVWYHDETVSLATEPFTINGQQITQLIYEDPCHVIGSDYYKLSGNQLLRSIYNALQSAQGTETPAPEKLVKPIIADYGDYFQDEIFSFQNAAGETVFEVAVIKQYYKPTPGADLQYPKQTVMLYDRLQNKFYSCPPTSYQHIEPILQQNLQYRQFVYSDAP